MEFLRMSKQFRQSFLNITSQYGNYLGIHVCSGIKPSPAVLGATDPGNIPALAASNGGAVLFSVGGDGYAVMSGADANGVMQIPDWPWTTAINSGIASYFIMVTYNQNWAVQGCLVGTISDSNGTGDLRLSNTAITKGVMYKVNKFAFTIPTDYNF